MATFAQPNSHLQKTRKDAPTLEDVAEEIVNGMLCHYEPPDPRRMKNYRGILRTHSKLGRRSATRNRVRWRDTISETEGESTAASTSGDTYTVDEEGYDNLNCSTQQLGCADYSDSTNEAIEKAKAKRKNSDEKDVLVFDDDGNPMHPDDYSRSSKSDAPPSPPPTPPPRKKERFIPELCGVQINCYDDEEQMKELARSSTEGPTKSYNRPVQSYEYEDNDDNSILQSSEDGSRNSSKKGSPSRLRGIWSSKRQQKSRGDLESRESINDAEDDIMSSRSPTYNSPGSLRQFSPSRRRKSQAADGSDNVEKRCEEHGEGPRTTVDLEKFREGLGEAPRKSAMAFMKKLKSPRRNNPTSTFDGDWDETLPIVGPKKAESFSDTTTSSSSFASRGRPYGEEHDDTTNRRSSYSSEQEGAQSVGTNHSVTRSENRSKSFFSRGRSKSPSNRVQSSDKADRRRTIDLSSLSRRGRSKSPESYRCSQDDKIERKGVSNDIECDRQSFITDHRLTFETPSNTNHTFDHLHPAHPLHPDQQNKSSSQSYAAQDQDYDERQSFITAYRQGFGDNNLPHATVINKNDEDDKMERESFITAHRQGFGEKPKATSKFRELFGIEEESPNDRQPPRPAYQAPMPQPALRQPRKHEVPLQTMPYGSGRQVPMPQQQVRQPLPQETSPQVRSTQRQMYQAPLQQEQAHHSPGRESARGQMEQSARPPRTRSHSPSRFRKQARPRAGVRTRSQSPSLLRKQAQQAENHKGTTHQVPTSPVLQARMQHRPMSEKPMLRRSAIPQSPRRIPGGPTTIPARIPGGHLQQSPVSTGSLHQQRFAQSPHSQTHVIHGGASPQQSQTQERLVVDNIMYGQGDQRSLTPRTRNAQVPFNTFNQQDYFERGVLQDNTRYRNTSQVVPNNRRASDPVAPHLVRNKTSSMSVDSHTFDRKAQISTESSDVSYEYDPSVHDQRQYRDPPREGNLSAGGAEGVPEKANKNEEDEGTWEERTQKAWDRIRGALASSPEKTNTSISAERADETTSALREPPSVSQQAYMQSPSYQGDQQMQQPVGILKQPTERSVTFGESTVQVFDDYQDENIPYDQYDMGQTRKKKVLRGTKQVNRMLGKVKKSFGSMSLSRSRSNESSKSPSTFGLDSPMSLSQVRSNESSIGLNSLTSPCHSRSNETSSVSQGTNSTMPYPQDIQDSQYGYSQQDIQDSQFGYSQSNNSYYNDSQSYAMTETTGATEEEQEQTLVEEIKEGLAMMGEMLTGGGGTTEEINSTADGGNSYRFVGR